MWRAALAAHLAGRIRTTEIRSSDYIEANSIFTVVLTKPLRSGTRAYVPAALDQPHSWTSIVDVAATLVTVANDDRAWGQAWLTPTNPPLTVREIATRFTEVVGAPKPKLTALPYPVLWTGGLFSPLIRELRTTRYQFVRPFVLDSSRTERTFALTPIDLNTALASLRT
jgi:nucleoside-diphosphate-sugar epimerase